MSNEDSDADEDFLAPIPGNEVNAGNGVDATQSSLTLLMIKYIAKNIA